MFSDYEQAAEVLRRQVIDATGPGTILHDFDARLDFVADALDTAPGFDAESLEAEEEGRDVEDESPEAEEEPPDFGLWQPLLQEFFPEWRNNLKFPEPEFRDGVYFFKVALGGPWRRIAIPAGCDLEDLAQTILRAFRFDGDHLHAFNVRERDGCTVRVMHPYVDDAEVHTDEYSVGYLPLEEGQAMDFEYDFGASWQFDVKLEKVEPPTGRGGKPRVVESHGKAPKEYEY